MANMITSSRILCSILLLFTPVFSVTFNILYIIAGITDMIDGTIARVTNTASEFGSRLDSIADIIFVIICMIKILPVLAIPTWLYLCIGMIAIIRVFNILLGYYLNKKYTAKHTIMNKLSGVVLFVLPLTISIVDLEYSGSLVCGITLWAAVQEGYMIITENKSKDIKSNS